ncbi:MAG: galactokinase [Clostridia bacterium]|nr:galactokinase [Clostridia bacterium]
MLANEYREKLVDGELDGKLRALYGDGEDNLKTKKQRFLNAIDAFEALFGEGRDITLFSVPGRSEISGNHTDHNRGKVIAGSVDLDIISVASKNADNTVRIRSRGFPATDVIELEKIDRGAYPKFKSLALVGGICHKFKEDGYNIGGFDAYTDSNVYRGSGLSSSAAFEVACCNMINVLYNDGAIPAPRLAIISQFAENEFFGKPCGLMDQSACAVGGFVEMDFADPSAPEINRIEFDLDKAGYSLCIVNTRGNHADLNDEYAAIPAEMKSVAKLFGRDYLRGVTYEQLLGSADEIRKKCGDRAFLRAMHFVNENARVSNLIDALKKGDIAAFLHGINESGISSLMMLQNVWSNADIRNQGLTIAIGAARKYLDDNCDKPFAVRVHGGGFAGTIQAFVPHENVEGFAELMDRIFGEDSCRVLRIRPIGATSL